MTSHRTLKCLALFFAPALLVISAVLFWPTSPAFAGSDAGPVCNSGPVRACVWFEDSGDKVYVEDANCDGHAAVAQVVVQYDGIADNLWNTAGCNTTYHWDYGTGMTEGKTVQIRACSGVYSTLTLYDCSTWLFGTS